MCVATTALLCIAANIHLRPRLCRLLSLGAVFFLVPTSAHNAVLLGLAAPLCPSFPQSPARPSTPRERHRIRSTPRRRRRGGAAAPGADVSAPSTVVNDLSVRFSATALISDSGPMMLDVTGPSVLRLHRLSRQRLSILPPRSQAAATALHHKGPLTPTHVIQHSNLGS